MSSPALPRHRVRPASARQTAPAPTARYRYDSVAGDWWWSPGMHELLGLDPLREPCTESFLAAHHPGDAARVIEAVTAACDRGRPFALEARVLHDGHHVASADEYPVGRNAVRPIAGSCRRSAE